MRAHALGFGHGPAYRCPPVRRVGRRERRVVGGQRAHRPGGGPGPLEAHGDPAQPPAPDPAGAELVVADVLPRPPAPVRRLAAGGSAPPPAVVVLRRARVVVLREQVPLGVHRQPGDADAEQPQAAAGAGLGEQPAGDGGDLAGVVGGLRQGRRAGQRGEVVAPQLQRHRAARERRGPQPARPPGRPSRRSARPSSRQVGEVGARRSPRPTPTSPRGRPRRAGRPPRGPAGAARGRAPCRPARPGRSATWRPGRPTVADADLVQPLRRRRARPRPAG